MKQAGLTNDQDLSELEAVLDQRIQEAGTKGVSTRTVEDIFQPARQETNSRPNA